MATDVQITIYSYPITYSKMNKTVEDDCRMSFRNGYMFYFIESTMIFGGGWGVGGGKIADMLIPIECFINC